VPSADEQAHDYLWRFAKAIPPKGSISIMNRSYYEDVLVAKVHKLYENQAYADRIDKKDIINQRYEQIRGFEKYLYQNNIRVVKVFLNVSREEQARRFIDRIDVPRKNWKISEGDITERRYWNEYMEAFESAVNKTGREHSPWYVVPADHKWYARLIISRIVLETLRDMAPQWPVLPESELAKLEGYRDQLIQEDGVNYEPRRKVFPYDIAVNNAIKSDNEAKDKKKKHKDKTESK
jgi:polyphosphate kinase 2 (PPK2 family)